MNTSRVTNFAEKNIYTSFLGNYSLNHDGAGQTRQRRHTGQDSRDFRWSQDTIDGWHGIFRKSDSRKISAMPARNSANLHVYQSEEGQGS